MIVIKNPDSNCHVSRKVFSLFSFPFSLFYIFLILIIFTGCQKPLYRDAEFYMGTYVEVTSNDARAKDIVFKEFRRLEAIINLFDKESELSRLNAAGTLVVSDDLFALLKDAKKFYVATGGAFDVTIAPVALLWKRAIKKQELPDDKKIKDALIFVGFDYVYLDDATRTVRLLREGANIDLGGIAKGYAVQSAVKKLREAAVKSALVNAGGNIYCVGKNNNKPWVVGIADPRRPGHIIKKISASETGVATSGDYEQFFIFQNKRYSHIIDPRTGYPPVSGIISATVLARDATTADALSTSLFILGKDKGAGVLAMFPGSSAKLISEDGKFYNL